MDILEKIKTSDKNLFVGLAGPGTGKSFTFKRIAEDGEFAGKNILILSFINKLVNDLEDEFKSFNNVEVSTLHSFAGKQLPAQNVDIKFEEDLDMIISEDFLFLEDKKVSFDGRFQDNILNKEEEAFYKKRKDFYAWDENEKVYSFNSVVYALIKVFSDESKIPSEYDLILIDEFQDFNKLEWGLIKLLSKKSKVILVGDDDQSLYSWKKAKPDQIRLLYDHEDSESFSLDDCYRCTKVIVQAVNDLVSSAKQKGFLSKNKEKTFNYPEKPQEKQIHASEKYPKIDFLPSVSGGQLIYHLAKLLKNDLSQSNEAKEEEISKDRILVIVPHFLKHKIYEGLTKGGFNVVEYGLFSNERNNGKKHHYLIGAFNDLTKRKTDDLALRKILFLYLEDNQIKDLIIEADKEDKKFWYCLDKSVKNEVEKDIEIFKKVKLGEEILDSDELQRFNYIFSLKKVLSQIVKGFYPTKRKVPEVEITTAAGSKGLSAEFVYYVGIDDKHLFNNNGGEIFDEGLCEFLVGVSRAKKKMTLFSLEQENPKILDFLNDEYINKIDI